jgi:alpha-amylase
VHFAQEIVLVGDSPALGAWQLTSAAAMTWGEGDVWSATVSLPAGADVAFKFVVTDPKR